MIKLKDLTCEKCFYARRTSSSFAVSEKLVECRRYPNAVMKGNDFGCGEGAWLATNKHHASRIFIYWYNLDKPSREQYTIVDPWWMEE